MTRILSRSSALTIFFLVLFISACKENPGEVSLGEEFIESETNLNLIDTFSVQVSTVILDTVVTSGTGSMLIGYYHDNTFGEIMSSSYFQIGTADSVDTIDVRDDDVYDSLNLMIRYNNYSFGDTTKAQKISVHQLSENIELNENNSITSGTSFNYNSNPVGSITYIPEPNNQDDTLFIKLSNNLGLDLFTKLKEDSEILTENESFINYFHGLVLKADDIYEGSIIQFKANEEDVKLILYTSRGELSTEKINYGFGLENTLKQFNNITHDFTSTPLNPLVEQRNELSSTQTGGLSFLQGGIGLVLRVDFPSLQEILLLDRGKIIQAQLSISPLQNSYEEFDLPSELIMYESDGLNRRNNFVFNNEGTVVSSSLILDELFQEETSYSFDVTKYLNDEIADSYIDPEKGILITLPSNASFNRLIIDAQNKNTKLKIYYLYY